MANVCKQTKRQRNRKCTRRICSRICRQKLWIQIVSTIRVEFATNCLYIIYFSKKNGKKKKKNRRNESVNETRKLKQCFANPYKGSESIWLVVLNWVNSSIQSSKLHTHARTQIHIHIHICTFLWANQTQAKHLSGG